METRREFLKKAAMLSGAAGVWSVLPSSIQKALAIDPDSGTTYLDAEHVVILMQENRSFDHCYGMLQGVRGFNDPRAHILADGRPVWVQSNPEGETYVPFHLDIKETNVTWMGSLPHSWTNQVDARNDGYYDRWLAVKQGGHKEIPLTLGHYSRDDIPFYYAFADAFTVCDQHFCSSLTGTTPNRLFLWTGTIREKQDASAFANVRNEEVDYGREAGWTTFPERLEDHGISWKIYQNEISLDSGFEGEQDPWLSNFTDNPIEWFTQFNVRYASGYQNYLEKREKTLTAELSAMKEGEEEAQGQKADELAKIKAERAKWSKENFERLSAREKNLHKKAFTINENDPDYRSLTSLKYQDGETERTVQVPKGDVLHQFRQDVQSGNLPTVSWLVGPENFSDHPGAAWYGAWYVSEALDILTQNPEVWKKTIFILTYDENDGYFDHVPPFVAPNPLKPETGLTSKGIDTGADYVQLEQDLKRKPAHEARGSAIGLGYRVPLVVASPWSRGSCVNSQVFDHTSVLQFLETFLTHKTGKNVEESNISRWRRTVCGDLTSIFQTYHGEKIESPTFLSRDAVIESIHKARFKKLPADFKGLTAGEIEEIKKSPTRHPLLTRQEKGTRRSCPLPYTLYADGGLNSDRSALTIRFQAKNTVFGPKAAGSPFNAYAYHRHGELQARSYAVQAADEVSDSWPLSAFEDGKYHVRVDGPNGFLREYKGSADEPNLTLKIDYARADVQVEIQNRDSKPHTVEIADKSYGMAPQRHTVAPGAKASFIVSTKNSHQWYDFALRVAGAESFERRCAGRVETGAWTTTDPAMA